MQHESEVQLKRSITEATITYAYDSKRNESKLANRASSVEMIEEVSPTCDVM